MLINVDIDVDIAMDIYVCQYVCICKDTYIYTCRYKYIMHIDIYVRLYECFDVSMNMYTRTLARIRTHTHM